MGLLPPDSRHADPVIQRLLDWLRGLAGAIVESVFGAAGVAVRFGSATATWPGGQPQSNTLTVTHGADLGAGTPGIALATPVGIGGPEYTVVTQVTSGTQFAAVMRNAVGNPAAGATRTFYWLVVG